MSNSLTARESRLSTAHFTTRRSSSAGRGALVCHIDGLPLRPDMYSLNVFLGANNAICDFVERAMSFEIAPVDVFGTGRMPDRNQGPLLAGFHWKAATPVLACTEEITT
jgi:hypothetical protein